MWPERELVECFLRVHNHIRFFRYIFIQGGGSYRVAWALLFNGPYSNYKKNKKQSVVRFFVSFFPRPFKFFYETTMRTYIIRAIRNDPLYEMGAEASGKNSVGRPRSSVYCWVNLTGKLPLHPLVTIASRARAGLFGVPSYYSITKPFKRH